VQPLLPSPAVGQASSSQEILTADIARCAGCAAYINHLCSFEKYGWACSLCGLQNDYSSVANRRYLGGPEARTALPELVPGVVEAFSPVHDDTEDESLYTPQELLTTPAVPIVVALVDVAACSEHLELVRSSLMAAIEGLSSDSKFGLIAFGGDDLAVFEPGPGGPCVRHIPLFNGGTGNSSRSRGVNGPTGAELAQVLPLSNVLTQVQGSGKRAITAAIEALEPMGAGKRPAGEALQAVLRFLGSSVSEDGSLTGALGARLIMILAGPPNCGCGSVLHSPISNNNNNKNIGGGGFLSSRNNADDFNAGAPFLLDPYYPEITAWSSQPDMAMQADKLNSHKRNNINYKNGGGGDGGMNGWTEAAESLAGNLGPAAAELGLVDKDDIAEVSISWESACKFYSEAGAAAAALGVVVDLYAVSASFVGLEALRAVAVGSGGSLALYPPPAVEECALPQDLYKRMAEPYAFGCLLRMRTCPELRVVESSSFGGAGGKSAKNHRISSRLRTDPRYSDVFHIACCHPYDAFQLQLEHATRSGFASKSTPVVQLVFQYLCIVPSSAISSTNSLGNGIAVGSTSMGGTPTKGAGMNTNTKSVLQRRTRIITTSFPLAHSAKEVYASVNPQAHTFTLLQYLCNLVSSDGIDSAKTALIERTVELSAAYHEWITIGEVVNDPGARRREGSMVPVDTAFKACEALQGLPRAAYALLRGPLLGGTATHPDSLCALRTLWDILPPAELATAIYPHLSSWASPDQLAFPRHSLCRAALALSRQPIYLLDSYRSLVVFYASQGHHHRTRDGVDAAHSDSAPFPPPHQSQLRQHCAALSQARRLTPRVTVVREGEPGADQMFGQWLIEDDRGSGAANGATFLDFLRQIKELVTELVNQQ